MSYTPYYPGGWKDWPDISTPTQAAAMQNIENQLVSLSSGGPLLLVNTAVTTILQNKLLSADANAAFTIGGDGKLQWGPGGASALDASLYRNAAAALFSSGTNPSYSLYDPRDATSAGGTFYFRTDVGAPTNAMASVKGYQKTAGSNAGVLDFGVNTGTSLATVARIDQGACYFQIASKAGTPSDLDLPSGLNVPSGNGALMMYDRTNKKIYVRDPGDAIWRSVTVT